LYFLIRGRSSMIPATEMPMLTSTADQRKTGAASTGLRVSGGGEGVGRIGGGGEGGELRTYRVDL
jgi:hypothetical protein